MANAPRTDDKFEAPDSRGAGSTGIFNQRLERYLASLYAAGDDADKRHDAALKELRRDAAEAIIAIARATGCCDSVNYPRRWALIYAATRMEHEAGLPLFRELVLAPIAEGKRHDDHRNTAMREETILRTTAIDGVGRLAARGSKRALEYLYEFLSVPSISIRRAAVQEILKASPRARKQVASLLPEEQRFLLDVKQVPVSKVRQVRDPTAHLRNPEARPKEGAPVLPDDGSRRGRSPRVGDK